ncbi:unnamed protein product, partial [Polarella glacialis]
MADVRSLNRLSLEELQVALEERGLDTDGKKFTLVERLSQAQAAEERDDMAADPYGEALAFDPYLDPAATFDPYLDPAAQDHESRAQGDRSRSRSRSLEGRQPTGSSEKARASSLRRLADNICGVGLQTTLASLDSAVTTGSVPSKLLAELEDKLCSCIGMIE